MRNIFLKPNDLLLTKIAQKIPANKISSEETNKIINIMLKISSGHRQKSKRPIMVGLAAPQIGISKRIILVDIKADGKGKVGDLRIYVNPEIIWKSKKEEEWYEGCYSTSKVCGIVSRPISIKISGSSAEPKGGDRIPTERWKSVKEKYKGYVARIFHHEIDHLNGKLFVDLIKNPDHLHWVLKKEFRLYRNKKAWKNWPKKCSFGRWQNLKSPLLKRA